MTQLFDALVEGAAEETCQHILLLLAIISLANNYVLSVYFYLLFSTAKTTAGSQNFAIREALGEVTVVDDLNCWHNQNNEEKIHWDNNRSENAKRTDWYYVR